jgi:hypothetical protein
VGAGSLAQDGALVFGGFDAERTLAGRISSPFSATRQPPRPYRERRTHQRSSVKDHLVRDTKHQDGNVVTGVLLLEVQNSTLYSAGHSRSVESN